MSFEVQHDTFLGLDPAAQTYANSRVILVRVPYDATTSYSAGARWGPAAIMAASTQVELYDLELARSPSEVGIYTVPALAPCVSGPEEMIAVVEQTCLPLIADEKFIFVLGGEHSVALGAVRALCRSGATFSVLQLDAHLDLRASYEGSIYSHAAVARRMLDALPSVTPPPLVQVGVRTACLEELDTIRSFNLEPFWGHQLQALPQEEWIDQVIAKLQDQVYITLDVDALDPSIMPGTGTPVPGGLSWYQTCALLKAVGAQRQVIGCDLCELAPIPGQRVSEFTAALLAHKMIGYFVP